MKNIKTFIILASILCFFAQQGFAEQNISFEAGGLHLATDNLWYQNLEYETDISENNLVHGGFKYGQFDNKQAGLFKMGIIHTLDDYDIHLQIGQKLASHAIAPWADGYYSIRTEYYYDDALSFAPLYEYYRQTHNIDYQKLSFRATYQGQIAHHDYIIYLMPATGALTNDNRIVSDMPYSATVGGLYYLNPLYFIAFENTIGQSDYQYEDILYNIPYHGFYHAKSSLNYKIRPESLVSLQANLLHFSQDNHIGGMIRYQQAF